MGERVAVVGRRAGKTHRSNQCREQAEGEALHAIRYYGNTTRSKGIGIYKVYFDAPGSDRSSNASLNAEYVVIKNGDDVSHSVSGWTVRDKAGHRYTFPDGIRLGAGKQAIIHTGDGKRYTTSASTHLYWGREWYVWNNDGDKVTLPRADGTLKDTCSYSGAGSRKYC